MHATFFVATKAAVVPSDDGRSPLVSKRTLKLDRRWRCNGKRRGFSQWEQPQQCTCGTWYGVMMKWFWAAAAAAVKCCLALWSCVVWVIPNSTELHSFGREIWIEESRVRIPMLLLYNEWGMLRAYVEQSGGLLTFHLFVGGWWKTFSFFFYNFEMKSNFVYKNRFEFRKAFN